MTTGGGRPAPAVGFSARVRRLLGVRTPRRRSTILGMGSLLAVALTAGLVVAVPFAANGSIGAITITGNGSAAVGGANYAKSGSNLTLNVTTSSNVRCVQVSGDFTAQQTNNQGKSSWSFPFTAGGVGAQTINMISYTQLNNGQGSVNGCNSKDAEASASYTIDDSAPVVSGTVVPIPNGAGWNNTDATVNWTATDTGSGLVPSTAQNPNPNPLSATITANTTTAGVVRSATALDRVGNSGSASVTIKVDKIPPSIAGSRTPPANGNGWNNVDVVVSFLCSDSGPSGLASCPTPVNLSGNGANQSVTGTALDVAGNATPATVSGISIDKVRPTLSGAPTTSPNANGWYNGDVVVAWTAADQANLSGLAGAAPANSTITGEGSALTASASVSDRAGNTTSATSSPAVKIDRTAPNTTANAPSAWNNTNVTVTLTATDALSGVAATNFKVDGGATQTGTSVAFTTEGDHTLEWWSTDLAGNVEAHKTANVKIDKTPPAISHTQSPAANGKGWNNTNVTVTFTCTDQAALSGIKTCTGPQTVTTEGKDQPVTGTATDNAGNTATDPATVSIDKTPPTITLSPDRAPNANGWYNADVIVTALCLDQAGLSGIDGCPLAVTLGEGANQTVSGTATDAAGNATPASLTGINVDKTEPTVTGHATTAPNADGWYSGDVTVAWTCADALSGLAAPCPATATIGGEGSLLGASQSATDKAGNTFTGSVGGINIDRTAPSTTVLGEPQGGAWQQNPVTLTFSALDNLSGLDKTFASVDGAPAVPATSLTLGDGNHTVSYWSVDKAGNAEAKRDAIVRVDTQLPTISSAQTPAPNGNGWNNTAVTVTFTCADQANLSDLVSCVPATTDLTTEGKGQEVTGTATDGAGNQQTAKATVDIDLTAPTATPSADRPANPAGWYRAPVTVSTACTDALSGVAACPASQTYTEGTAQAYTGTAVDAAGNTTPVSLTGINVDLTAPTLSAAPTTAPNDDGWYNKAVTFQWTCSDEGGSGLDGPCPADATISTEGVDQRVSADIADVAGNPTHGLSGPVSIDLTAPTTEANAPTGWARNDVHVTLTASDSLSGLATTHYTVNGGPEQTGTTIPFTAEGEYNLSFWSVDKAGNVEKAHTAVIRIDKTNPEIVSAQDPKANAAGWNNTAVHVTFTCTDLQSGVASCVGETTLTGEGDNQQVTGTATDTAGNTASTTQTLRIDLTPPTISASRAPGANAQGWNNQSVTVTFSCDDLLSQIASCPPAVTVDDTTDRTVTGTATDAAGNTASASVEHINVDTVAPGLSGAPTTAANAAGWYQGDVAIHWTCTDDRSGVAECPADSVITGEGLARTASASVADIAGNQTSAISAAVNIDRTAPITEIDAPGIWRNGPVDVALTAGDNLSGLASTWYTVDGGAPVQGTTFAVSGDGVHTITFWSVDQAGNTEAAHSATVKIDTKAPTITHTVTPAPNGAGWNRTVPVTVDFTCADQDGLSGVAGCGPTPQTFGTNGANQLATANATDVAGNTATDTVTVKIDTVAPQISAATDRQPDNNGWYNHDVTVSFTCGDGLSGIAGCPAPKVLAEGADQSASGTATDAADNTASATLAGINVDKTKPTLTGAPTAPPDGTNGWYRSPVTIHWTATDTLSGIDSAPADTILDQDDTGQTATATVSDRAGNDTTATSAAVKIDRTAPKTLVDAPSNWVNAKVTVTLDASDNLSGVASTHFKLDGGPDTTGVSVPVTGDGSHTLLVWSVDNAGNAEAATPYTILIDTTGPTITGAITPAPNAANWNNTDATVTFTCADPDGSGIATCTKPVLVTTEGAAQPVIGTATDVAGNSTNATVEVSLDKTPPTISAGIAGAPSASNGWYNQPLTVTFACDDQLALSGLKSCSDSVVVGQGANQSVSGAAADNAGNTATAKLAGLNVDTTAPTLTGAPTAAANAAGWYRGDVTIHWTCTDALSGIGTGACPTDSTVGGEGKTLSATATVADKAGNETTATVGGLKIDRTDPTTSATAPSGWQKGTVSVSLTAGDNLSGVAGTFYSIDGGPATAGTTFNVAGTGVHQVSYWSVDNAGNTESAKAVTVSIDNVAPTITAALAPAPNANGWLKVPGTVSFTCADTGGSALAAQCPAPITVSSTGATGQVVSGAVADNAGNTSTASVTVKVDTLAPTVTIAGVTQGAKYKLGAVPKATCAAADAVSGLDGTCTVALTGGTRLGVGTITATATAKDKAGNVGTVSVTYQVNYAFGRVFCLQPVNDTDHDKGSGTSIFKGGSTIPIKFQLFDAYGRLVQAENAPVWVTPVSTGKNGAAVNESNVVVSGDSGTSFRYDGQQYHYNWNTGKNQIGQYWQAAVRLDDGTTQYVKIGLS